MVVLIVVMIMNQKGTNKDRWNIYTHFFSISLNQEKRRKELLRVSKENATLAKRIIDCRLDTNRENWKSSWSKNAAYLDNISKFEPDWHGTNVWRNLLIIIKEFSFF